MPTSSARLRVRLLLPAAGIAAALLLGGCGSDDSDSTAQDPAADGSASSSAPATDGPTGAQLDWPTCSQVWSDGAKLPSGYAGCLDGGKAGEVVKADRYPCSSGQRLITYDDRYYATAGGTITRTQGSVRQDGGFRQVLAVCQG